MKVIYYCNICKLNHDLALDKELINKQSSFPFPYYDLHGVLRDILAKLWIDKDFKVRGVEAMKLSQEDKIFSQDFASDITQKLVNEIARLEEENKKLREELTRFKK